MTSLCGKGCVSGSHVQGVDLVGTQSDQRPTYGRLDPVWVHTHIDGEVVDVLFTDPDRQLHVAGVDRVRRGLDQVDRTVADIARVLYRALQAGELLRGVTVEHAAHTDVVLQRGGQHIGLVRRARLCLMREGVVDDLRSVRTTVEGLDLPGAGIHRGQTTHGVLGHVRQDVEGLPRRLHQVLVQGGLDGVTRGRDVSAGDALVAPFDLVDHRVTDVGELGVVHLFGVVLDRLGKLQSLGLGIAQPQFRLDLVELDELLLHVGPTIFPHGPVVWTTRFGVGEGARLLNDHADERALDLVGLDELLRPLGPTISPHGPVVWTTRLGVGEGTRLLNDHADESALGLVQITDRLVEVGLRGGLDPGGVASEVDRVEVLLQDLVLLQLLGQLQGDEDLTDLALHRLFLRQTGVVVTGHLLGDGRTSTGLTTRQDRACGATDADTRVVVEGVLFGGEHPADDGVRDLLEVDGDPVDLTGGQGDLTVLVTFSLPHDLGGTELGVGLMAQVICVGGHRVQHRESRDTTDDHQDTDDQGGLPHLGEEPLPPRTVVEPALTGTTTASATASAVPCRGTGSPPRGPATPFCA